MQQARKKTPLPRKRAWCGRLLGQRRCCKWLVVEPVGHSRGATVAYSASMAPEQACENKQMKTNI
jgi:hypothetical protein